MWIDLAAGTPPRHGSRSTLDLVQRAFSAFPSGPAGAALAALRVCIGAQMLVRDWPALCHSAWAGSAAWLIALALACGLATPFAALLSIAAGWLIPAAAPAVDAALIFECVHGLVLCVLGPGAYSFDARLYGRRVIDLSHATGGRPPEDDDSVPWP